MNDHVLLYRYSLVDCRCKDLTMNIISNEQVQNPIFSTRVPKAVTQPPQSRGTGGRLDSSCKARVFELFIFGHSKDLMHSQPAEPCNTESSTTRDRQCTIVSPSVRALKLRSSCVEWYLCPALLDRCRLLSLQIGRGFAFKLGN